MDDELVEHAQELVRSNRYLVLGSVDPEGRPWTSPVYFAADHELRHFYWMSTETSRHSANLAAGPDVSLVVFDSTVPPYHGRCLYAVGAARVLAGDDVRRGLTTYPGPPARGGAAVSVDDVTGTSPWRLYRAETSALWVLCPREPGQACTRHGRADDHRQQVK